MNSTVQAQLDEYLRAKAKVTVFESDERGEGPEWAVEVVDSGCFWLGTFPTEAEALAFCKVHDLEVS